MAFSMGIGVCLFYWATGYIPREWWFDSGNRVSEQLIIGKLWLWPTVVLGQAFRDTTPTIAVLVMYALNGATYAVVSLLLRASRGTPGLYAFVAIATLAALVWFNAAVMKTFSWLWLAVIMVLLTVIAVVDLRRAKGRDDV